MARSQFLKKLVLAGASVLVLFVVVEAVARLAEPGPFSLFDSHPYRPHPELPHEHRPSFRGRWDGTWYGINALGLRGPEIEPQKAEGELRVVALGDSCTFGKGVVDGDTWPRQLEGLLGEDLGGGRSAVVANLGVNGYSGKDYRARLLGLGLELEPDLVLIGYNLNDFPNVIRRVDRALYGETKKLRRTIPKELRDWMGRLASYRWLRSTYYRRGSDRAYQEAERFASEVGKRELNPEAMEREEGYIRDMVEASRAAGARVAVFLFPYESQVVLEDYDRSPIDRVRESCDLLGVRFVDLAEDFRRVARETDPQRKLFIPGDRYHPNREGYRLVAQRVLEVMRDEGWLSGPD